VAQQIRSINPVVSVLHNIVILLWTIASGIFYGCASTALSIVSLKAARKAEMLFHRQLLAVCGVRVITEGLDRIKKDQRYIFLANHQSFFDIPVLSRGIGRHLSFVAKKELFTIPFFGWGMSAVGHIKIDRENPRKARLSILKAVSILQQKNISLVLFPEGTRSPAGKLTALKRASLTIALEAGVPIVPVVICGAWKINKKKSLRFLPGTVKLIITEPIPADVAISMDKVQLTEKVQSIMSLALDGAREFND
jgi:1-acyl-sn-glycerol-3-phosphate acyltransferase